MDNSNDANLLFSFDIESYIGKTAVFSQRTASMFPVELVKTALKRGADRIDISIGGKEVIVSDNGNGIEFAELKMLLDLKDRDIPVELKEKIVSRLKGKFGPGLLAIFAPTHKIITVENVNSGSGEIVEISNREKKIDGVCSINSGTKISIHRSGGDVKREVEILKEYCGWTEATISLNGKVLEKVKGLPNTVASAKIDSKSSSLTGVLGIPESGWISRIFITENGIIRRKIEVPPYRGILFTAVFETERDDCEGIVTAIVPYVEKLYRFLIKNYPKFKPVHKERIEELCFYYYKKTGNKEFMSDFKPFRVMKSNSFIGIDEVEKLAGAGKLYIKNINNPAKVNYGLNSVFAVELNPVQIDFILNQLKLPAKIIDRIGIYKRNFKESILLGWSRFKNRLFSGEPLFRNRIIENDQLWNEEKELLFRLNKYFKDIWRQSDSDCQEIEIFMVKGPGLSPVYLKKGEENILNGKCDIYLRRGNGRVKKIVKLLDAQPENFELILTFIKIESGIGLEKTIS